MSSLYVVQCGQYKSETGYDTVYPKKEDNHDYKHRAHRIQAAVQTKHNIRFVEVDVPNYKHEAQIIEVEPNAIPLIIHFKSASSRIQIQQSHSHQDLAPIQETKSEDHPHHLRHEVTKPIIQEVHEIVKPYRRVIQEIRPVVEEIQTIVSKKSEDNRSDQYPKEESGGIVGSVKFPSGKIRPELRSSIKRSANYVNNDYSRRYH